MTKHSAKIFIKSQASAIIATLADFGFTIFLKEVLGVWYLLSTSAGSILGGIVNFILGRRWVFNAIGLPVGMQAAKYVMVWGGSILLNVSGVFLLTNFGHINYLFSKTITALVIGIFFNYNLQKKYVFSLPHEN